MDEHFLLKQYIKEIGSNPRLTSDEEADLVGRIRADDQAAFDRLVQAHLRFVVKVAMEYRNKGLPILDLINEGNIGLMSAARRFDETRGTRFNAYAVWWIRQAIRQAFAEYVRPIRLPRLQVEKLARLKGRIRLHEQVSARPVNLEQEIYEETNGKIAALNMSHLLAVNSPPASLNEPREGEDTRFGQTIPDTIQCPVDEEIMQRELKEDVHLVMDDLPDREALVLRRYYGLCDDEPQSLETIGRQMGLSRERIRQIKDRGLQQLRHHACSVRLQALL